MLNQEVLRLYIHSAVAPSGLLLTLLGERGGRLATAQNREVQFLWQIRVQFPKSLV